MTEQRDPEETRTNMSDGKRAVAIVDEKQTSRTRKKSGDGKRPGLFDSRRPSFFEGPRASVAGMQGNAESSIEDCYSWVVMVAALVSHILMFGICWTVGVYYVIFLEVFKTEKGPTSWIGSINTACVCFTGPFAGYLLKKFDNRVVMIVGCLMAFVGLIGSSTATNIYHLYGTFGAVTGCGIGLTFLPCISILGSYFDRRRTLALGIAGSGTGFGTLIYPPLIRYLDEEYGWRGSLIIMAGITLNLLVTAMIMKPKPVKKIHDSDPGIPTEKIPEPSSYSMFKNFRFVLICLGSLMQMFGFSIVYIHFAVYAKYQGVSDDESAILYSCIGIANFVGRVIYGFIGNHPRINVLVAYILSVIVLGIPIEAIPLVHTFGGLMVISFFFGFLSGSIGPLTPDILIQFLGVDRFAQGLGYLISFEGVGQLLGAPVAGWIFDATQTYSYSFYLSGTCVILSKLILLPALKRLPDSEVDVEEGWMNSNLLENGVGGKLKSTQGSVPNHLSSLLTVRHALFQSEANLHHIHAFGSQIDFGTRPNFLFGSDIITGEVVTT